MAAAFRSAGCSARAACVADELLDRSADLDLAPGLDRQRDDVALDGLAADLEAQRGDVGVAQRQELRGEVAGVKVIDDFAHHPTAIATTLEGLAPGVAAEGQGGRLWAVIEPRSNTMKLGTMKAHYTNDAGDVRVIRPLAYVRETMTAAFAREAKLPVIPDSCPACFSMPTQREQTKLLLRQLEKDNRNLFANMLHAMRPLLTEEFD